MKNNRHSHDLTRIKRFFNEFRTFAIKGNMIDMAVGIIVGGAFTALVNSIISNVAMPLIGILIGVDFQSLQITLPRPYGNAEPSTLGVGPFINSIITFVVVAFTVFLFVKALNRFRKKQDDAPTPKPTDEARLLAEIRDLLKARDAECGHRDGGDGDWGRGGGGSSDRDRDGGSAPPDAE